MKRILCVVVSLTVLMVALLIVLPSFVQAATIRVEAFIDGRSQLILKGNTARWQHFDYAAPGDPGGSNYPTIINYANWTPSLTASDYDCDGCYSDFFSGVCPGLSAREQTVTVTPIQIRDSYTIIQQPLAVNDYTFIIELNDNPTGGAAWYIFELNFPNANACVSSVPILTQWGMMIFMVLAGLGAVYYLRRRRVLNS